MARNQENEMRCDQKGLRPATAKIAIMAVALASATLPLNSSAYAEDPRSFPLPISMAAERPWTPTSGTSEGFPWPTPGRLFRRRPKFQDHPRARRGRADRKADLQGQPWRLLVPHRHRHTPRISGWVDGRFLLEEAGFAPPDDIRNPSFEPEIVIDPFKKPRRP